MESYECGFSYSIILTDFNMPVMNGIESTRRIREYFDNNLIKREDQPIIIGVTGHV